MSVDKNKFGLWVRKRKTQLYEKRDKELCVSRYHNILGVIKSDLSIDLFRSIFLTEIHTECSRKTLKCEFMQGKYLLQYLISENFPSAAGPGGRKGVAHHILLVYNYILFFGDCCFPS